MSIVVNRKGRYRAAIALGRRINLEERGDKVGSTGRARNGLQPRTWKPGVQSFVLGLWLWEQGRDGDEVRPSIRDTDPKSWSAVGLARAGVAGDCVTTICRCDIRRLPTCILVGFD